MLGVVAFASLFAVVASVDPNGYVFFCLCMGRFGNQLEHLLGGMAFAKELNRTLILPPFRTYKNIEFDEWFQVEPMRKYHRVILAKDFMLRVAPEIWPPEKRLGFCYQLGETPCVVKYGNPHGTFWDELGVDFVDHVRYNLGSGQTSEWRAAYSGAEYPVIALRGSPASFPMKEQHLPYQNFLLYSDFVRKEAEASLLAAFGSADGDYVAVHLRLGSDWKGACEHRGAPKFMASYQCQGWDYVGGLTQEMCYNTRPEIFRQIRRVVAIANVKKLLIATDEIGTLLDELKHEFPQLRIAHPNPWLPVVDTYLLSNSKLFIGNCVSSFSAFVWRYRNAQGLGETSYFGMDINKVSTIEL